MTDLTEVPIKDRADARAERDAAGVAAALAVNQADEAIARAVAVLAEEIADDGDDLNLDRLAKRAEALDSLALANGRGRYGPQGGRMQNHTDYSYRSGALAPTTRVPAGFINGQLPDGVKPTDTPFRKPEPGEVV